MNYNSNQNQSSGKDSYRNEHDSYGDGDVPEIDYNKARSEATNVIPDEIPRRDGPGGN